MNALKYYSVFDIGKKTGKGTFPDITLHNYYVYNNTHKRSRPLRTSYVGTTQSAAGVAHEAVPSAKQHAHADTASIFFRDILDGGRKPSTYLLL